MSEFTETLRRSAKKKHSNTDGLCTLSCVVGVLCLTALVLTDVKADYVWERDYSFYWNLSDKSSTIPAKQIHIHNFVESISEGWDHGHFSPNNAVIFKTPNNSFTANLKALETLSQRLSEIREMNPNSFEYNTAIQQITAQEQGEAHALMSTLKGCFILQSYPVVWGWIGLLCFLASFILATILPVRKFTQWTV
jgi:hypothetical protein